MNLFYLRRIYIIFVLHFFGDYFLQNDFIAKTKGSNWWHLIVHSVLYTAPFSLWMGINWRIALIFITHFIVDAMKSRYEMIDYVLDQTIHLFIVSYLYLFV